MKNKENPGLLARITRLKPIPFYISLYCMVLFFLGSCVQKEVKVFCIGDSTMSEYNLEEMDEKYGGTDFPRRGWAMALSAYLNDKAEVRNMAVSGRSSKNFIAQGHWDKVLNEIKEGDFLIIQFGHNDEKSDDPNRFTEPFGEYKENLIRFVKESEALGALPIMATPIARRSFNEEGLPIDTHGDYVTATREAAKEAGVPMIDLNKMTMDYLSELGAEDAKKLFLHVKPGVFENLPEGLEDDTHLSKQGACAVSEMFIEGIEKSDSPLKKYQLANKPECYTIIK
ncbi:rhamnogalacturonan acetylesterase [Cyclobacterium qasimii]|nr:rhamnogalacturonan acetylesterase [Cyclobacterium qasimii]